MTLFPILEGVTVTADHHGIIKSAKHFSEWLSKWFTCKANMRGTIKAKKDLPCQPPRRAVGSLGHNFCAISASELQDEPHDFGANYQQLARLKRMSPPCFRMSEYWLNMHLILLCLPFPFCDTVSFIPYEVGRGWSDVTQSKFHVVTRGRVGMQSGSTLKRMAGDLK